MKILELNETLPIRMECRANEKTSATVYEDEPLILSVAILNDAAIHAVSHNASLKIQRQELERKFNAKMMKQEEFKKAVEEIERRMLEVTIFRFGGPMGWPNFIKFQVLSEDTWRESDWPLELLTYYPAGQMAELNASTSCYVEFSMAPQETAQRPLGEFQVKAVAEIVEGKTVESNVVTVNLLQQKLPKAERSKEENLLAKGRYSYKRGLYEEAQESVQRALQVNPHSIQSLILLGDIEERRRNLSAALSTYKKALEEFYKQYPDIHGSPRSLISKINRLLASKKN